MSHSQQLYNFLHSSILTSSTQLKLSFQTCHTRNSVRRRRALLVLCLGIVPGDDWAKFLQRGLSLFAPQEHLSRSEEKLRRSGGAQPASGAKSLCKMGACPPAFGL